MTCIPADALALWTRTGIQNEGWSGRLGKIEAVRHVIGHRVANGQRLQSETFFRKFQEGREFVLSVGNVPAAGVRGNDQQRNTRPEAERINLRRRNMIVNPPKSSHVRKIAVLGQSGPCITALTCATVQFSPSQVLFGGCSLTFAGCTSQLTAGNCPFCASATNCV